MLESSTAMIAWLTGVIGFVMACAKLWQKLIIPKVINPVKAHFELVHRSARSVEESQKELAKIKEELTHNGGKSLKDLISKLHQDHRDSGRSLARLEGLVQAILSASKDGVWMANERGECLWVNGWFAENIGWMPNEMTGAGWKNTIHPDFRELVFEEWDSCIREHRDFILDFAYTTKSGKKVMVHAQCHPIRHNGTTDIVGRVGFVHQPKPQA